MVAFYEHEGTRDMPLSPYASEHDREQAMLERMVVRLRAAGEPLGAEVLDTAELFIRSQAVIHTANAYARALLRYFGWCVANAVDPWKARHGHAGMFTASLHELAPGTRRNYVIATRSFYRYAVIDEVIANDPFRLVKTPQPDAATPTPALTQQQLSFIQKGGGGHTLILPPEDADILEAWRADLTGAIGREVTGQEPVFPNIGHRTLALAAAPLAVMTRAGLRDAVKARYLAVGLRAKRLAFHALRATSATIGHEMGASLEEIQQTGGWKSQKMVELYIKRRTPRTALHRWSLDLDDPAA